MLNREQRYFVRIEGPGDYIAHELNMTIERAAFDLPEYAVFVADIQREVERACQAAPPERLDSITVTLRYGVVSANEI